ncbi:MAG: HAD family hydrolase [Herbinix sp.]|nr:HAD family hydrolase [Herbinix sp.]
MKTLYISDMDGTLLHPNATLSPKTINIINELIEQGMLFSVATARSIASVKTLLEDVKISLPIVLMNGVCIYDLSKNDYIKVEFFSKKSIDIMMSIIKDNHLKGFAYTIRNGVMSTYYEDLDRKALHDFYQERVDRFRKQFIQVDDFTSLSGEPLMYYALLDQKEQLEPIFRIVEEIPELNCVFYKDNYSPDLWYLEIYSKTASKFHAVQFLRSYLNLDNVVCFGDNRNDFPLFKASDYKIAVGNAVAELQGMADLVIGNNYDDGVADWLKQNFTRNGEP